jgi:hypothetical protein
MKVGDRISHAAMSEVEAALVRFGARRSGGMDEQEPPDETGQYDNRLVAANLCNRLHRMPSTRI